jgi:hypothetical protein
MAVKKYFLVEEDQLPVESTLGGGAGGGSKSTANMAAAASAAAIALPTTKISEKELLITNNDINSLLADPTIPLKTKWLRYLQLVKRLLRLRLEWEEEGQNADVLPDRQQQQQQHDVVEQRISEQQPISIGRPQQVHFNPSTVLEFGEKQQLFSQSNMLKDVHSRMQPRFNTVLNGLKTNKKFGWDTATGEVTINNQLIPGSNVRDLIMHKLRVDMNENGHTPPDKFHKFNQFLKRHNLQSSKRLRSKPGPAVPARTLSKKVAAAVRDKREQLYSGKKKFGGGYRSGSRAPRYLSF